MTYVEEIMEQVVKNNPGQPEFHQAVKEVLDSIALVIDKHEEEYRELRILERLLEPERSHSFRVAWIDHNGKAQGEPRLPRSVQQRDRPVQGRPSFPSDREFQRDEFPCFRADLQERSDRSGHRRRQGRFRFQTRRARRILIS